MGGSATLTSWARVGGEGGGCLSSDRGERRIAAVVVVVEGEATPRGSHLYSGTRPRGCGQRANGAAPRLRRGGPRRHPSCKARRAAAEAGMRARAGGGTQASVGWAAVGGRLGVRGRWGIPPCAIENLSPGLRELVKVGPLPMTCGSLFYQFFFGTGFPFLD